MCFSFLACVCVCVCMCLKAQEQWLQVKELIWTKCWEEKSDINDKTLDLHQESGISKMKDTKLI